MQRNYLCEIIRQYFSCYIQRKKKKRKKILLSIMKLRVSFTVVAKICNLFFFFYRNCIAAGQNELSRLFRMRGMQSEVRSWQEAGNCHRDKYSLCFRGVLSRDIPNNEKRSSLSLSLHPENESPLGNLFPPSFSTRLVSSRFRHGFLNKTLPLKSSLSFLLLFEKLTLSFPFT